MNVRGMAVGYSGCSDQRAETTCDADALVNIPVVSMLQNSRICWWLWSIPSLPYGATVENNACAREVTAQLPPRLVISRPVRAANRTSASSVQTRWTTS
jgi:hypothetical protein